MEPGGSSFLRPCSNPSRTKLPDLASTAEENGDGSGGREGDLAAVCSLRSKQLAKASRALKKGRGGPARDSKKAPGEASSSSSVSSVPSSSSSRLRRHRHFLGGLRIRGINLRGSLVSRGRSCGEDGLQDLALSIGMSFAAVVVQVLDNKNISGKRMPIDHLPMICTSAVKEAVRNIYGNHFDSFLINFEKSFGSTLKTLWKVNDCSKNEPGDAACNAFTYLKHDSEPASGALESCRIDEEFHESSFDNQEDSIGSQVVLHGEINQQLACGLHGIARPESNQPILSCFERSVMEQSRSNDLKAFEISLMMKQLQMKQSALDLKSDANLLDKIKISLGISKASFKEDKLRNQMKDARNAEFLKRSIDLLVTGLIIMCVSLLYGAYIFSYDRIMDATSSCTPTRKDTRSWWIPQQMMAFTSGWDMLRCHVIILSRMLFGMLLILSIAYMFLLRSAASGSTMPVTFILLLLGFACGVAGKLCVDTLGGNGYCWLVYWEALCLLHFFANVFPAAMYSIFYGPVHLNRGSKLVRVPYWLRRFALFSILLLVLPTLCGLLPFASLRQWKDHFLQKIVIWRMENESEL